MLWDFHCFKLMRFYVSILLFFAVPASSHLLFCALFPPQIFARIPIFVGLLLGSLILSSGRNPATEGDTLELTCNITSTSLPAVYRPNIISISWYNRGDWLREPFFNGSLMDRRGNIIPGYMSKNNGITLVISSVDYLDQYIRCSGGEYGGPFNVDHTHSVKILCE